MVWQKSDGIEKKVTLLWCHAMSTPKYLLRPSTFNTLLADELLYIEKGI